MTLMRPNIIQVPTLLPESLAFTIKPQTVVVPEFLMQAYRGGDPVARFFVRHELFHSRPGQRFPPRIEEALANYVASKYLPFFERLKLTLQPLVHGPGPYIEPGINDVIRFLQWLRFEQGSLQMAAEAARPGLLSTIKNIARHKGMLATIPYWERFLSVMPARAELHAPYKELLRRITTFFR